MGAKQNLTGKRFGKLTVLKEVPKAERHDLRRVEWECLCDCGNTTRVITNYLNSGHTTSCGCRRAEACTETFTLDIAGQKFGRLTAIENTGKLGCDKTKIWKCICECGNYHWTTLN